MCSGRRSSPTFLTRHCPEHTPYREHTIQRAIDQLSTPNRNRFMVVWMCGVGVKNNVSSTSTFIMVISQKPFDFHYYDNFHFRWYSKCLQTCQVSDKSEEKIAKHSLIWHELTQNPQRLDKELRSTVAPPTFLSWVSSEITFAIRFLMSSCCFTITSVFAHSSSCSPATWWFAWDKCRTHASVSIASFSSRVDVSDSNSALWWQEYVVSKFAWSFLEHSVQRREQSLLELCYVSVVKIWWR